MPVEISEIESLRRAVTIEVMAEMHRGMGRAMQEIRRELRREVREEMERIEYERYRLLQREMERSGRNREREAYRDAILGYDTYRRSYFSDPPLPHTVPAALNDEELLRAMSVVGLTPNEPATPTANVITPAMREMMNAPATPTPNASIPIIGTPVVSAAEVSAPGWNYLNTNASELTAKTLPEEPKQAEEVKPEPPREADGNTIEDTLET